MHELLTNIFSYRTPVLRLCSILHFYLQVLVKASKIIPVMVMGKVVSNKKFEYYEYVTAVMMSTGMVLFMLNNSGDHTGMK